MTVARIEDDGLPNIADMTDGEMIAELVSQQRRVIENMDRHMRIHQIIRVRTQDYMAGLMENAHIDGEGSSDGPEGFLSESNNGQYL
jgi:hypothetical protein